MHLKSIADRYASELKKILTQFGEFESVKLMTDKAIGKRKGFGIIDMEINH
ncbi:hypothetical protein HDF24_02875 [Mucilaginibacter sp. X4EP1]|jgi:RNA recognition motif-containing protein|uniref:RNA recognition motif domain-containing protein n=1 Tax=Mucilaginibacter sp. X4EP1 TaxID=2723092 RepID=UPI002166CB4D|nr:RNA-binding protein [Mucilaginibacter sp. X4EP1]MCS3811965.1 RNA recognition motif-containing protein [Mucilaginibacter sp. X4EP1]